MSRYTGQHRLDFGSGTRWRELEDELRQRWATRRERRAPGRARQDTGEPPADDRDAQERE